MATNNNLPTQSSLLAPRRPSYVSVIVITALVSVLVTTTLWFSLNFATDYLKKTFNKVTGKEMSSNNTVVENKTVVVKEESAVIDTVKKVKPAVVSIIATKQLETYYRDGSSLNDPFYNFFFGPSQQQQQPQADQGNPSGSQKTKIGGGSGFFISADGLVATNKHVIVDDAAEYTVIDGNGKEYQAKILAKDPTQDIAVLKVEGKDFPVVELGDSEKLEVGQTVVAIGNSLGEYSNTVTRGVVSGIGRTITAGDQGSEPSETIDNVIQTDAAINPGNSGGPLLNIAGQVIGINTAIDVSGQLIGFAIPVNDVKASVEMVKKNGRIVKPYLGIRYLPVTKDVAQKNNLPVEYGILVSRGQNQGELAVLPGSPADKAGIVENDLILEVNGKRLDKNNELSRMLQKMKVGEEITLKVSHAGEEKVVKVKLEERKSN